MDHAVSCLKGGFVHRRHDEIRDLLATVIDEGHHDVSTEPALTPLTGEVLPPSANSADDARVDIAARGFWQRCEKAFFLCQADFLTLMPQHIDARDQRKRKREEETVQPADCRGRAWLFYTCSFQRVWGLWGERLIISCHFWERRLPQRRIWHTL